MSVASTTQPWSLEVVRGAAVGHRYVLGPGDVVLGNARHGDPGIDLGEQERASPRRMAAKQATLRVSQNSLALRDLDSPGGTFLNQRRIPPGSTEPLNEGDVIQLGGVQLRVSRGNATSPPRQEMAPRIAPSSPFLFSLKTGQSARSWDDFLAISSQSWVSLRDELTSGRLSAFLDSIGRSDLAPGPSPFDSGPLALSSVDLWLDAWLRKIPSRQPARPEIEVHPRSVVVRGSAGGGSSRRKVQVNNIGHGVLRGKVRIEPAGISWIRLDSQAFALVESGEIAFDVAWDDRAILPLKAALVLESDGGAARVEVRVESSSDVAPEEIPEADRLRGGVLRSWIARQSATSRGISWTFIAILARLMIAGSPSLVASVGSPGLAGPSLVFGLIGAIVALGLAARNRGDFRDMPSSAFAGSIVGAILASILVATCRTIAPAASSWWVVVPIWAVLGAGLAGLSLLVVPAETRS